jgi:hypothetical protein
MKSDINRGFRDRMPNIHPPQSMKQVIFLILFGCLAALSSRADLIYYEPFNYADGAIITNSSGLWTKQGGTASPSDALVKNQRMEISATGGTVSRQDDVNRRFSITNNSPYTNAQMVIYSSFTVNCTNLPNAAGTYIGHFMGHVGTSIFMARVYALGGTNLCLPNTWRLGIAAIGGTVNKIYPVDLATNVDYQVVVSYDPGGSQSAQLWVNPITSGDLSVQSSDPVTGSAVTNIIAGFGFRQASGFGNAFFNVTNLAVATTFEEAATNVWAATNLAPTIEYPLKGATNFGDNPLSLSVVANGRGLPGLIYQWEKDGSPMANPDGNTNVLFFPLAQPSDSGQYDVIVRTPDATLSVTSAVVSVVITNQPVPPTISKHPTNTTVYFGQTATLTTAAFGPQPISYQWYYNNGIISGANDTNLVILNVQTNNNTTGTYRCDVTNPFGTVPSSNAVLSVVGAPVVTIGYLRTLVDGVFFLPTNTSALYTVSGTVTTFTNITTTGNASFFMQDGTGGIDVFFGGSASGVPEAGDNVTVTGPLGQFNSLLELNLSASDPAHTIVTNSHNNPLPSGVVLPFSFTNSPAYGGVSNAIRLYEGAVVTLTNVYFPAAATNGAFVSGANYIMTNRAGEGFFLRVDSRIGDIIGQPVPAFAWRVTGPMSFFLGSTTPDRSSGFQILPTRYIDIVTTPPLPPVAAIQQTGGNPDVKWAAEPFTSYSILRSTNVQGPYVPLVSGLTFNTTNGVYTDTNTAPPTRFYQIVSP